MRKSTSHEQVLAVMVAAIDADIDAQCAPRWELTEKARAFLADIEEACEPTPSGRSAPYLAVAKQLER